MSSKSGSKTAKTHKGKLIFHSREESKENQVKDQPILLKNQ